MAGCVLTTRCGSSWSGRSNASTGPGSGHLPRHRVVPQAPLLPEPDPCCPLGCILALARRPIYHGADGIHSVPLTRKTTRTRSTARPSRPVVRTKNLSSVGRAPREAGAGDQADSMFDLVARAQTGDRAALDELLVRSLPLVQRWAHGRLPAYARGALDTDDLVQQAAYRTLKRLHLFQPRHVYSLQAYLREAVVNRIRDAVRTQTRHGLKDNPAVDIPVEERRDEHAPSPLEQVLRQETVDRYRRGLKKLKAHEQRAVVLRLELDMDYDELAVHLGKASQAAARMAAR